VHYVLKGHRRKDHPPLAAAGPPGTCGVAFQKSSKAALPMRLFPVLTAIVVAAVLYLAVFERDRLLELAGRTPTENEAATLAGAVDGDGANAEEPPALAAEAAAANRVSVVAFESGARRIDDAVIVRGRTEAAREVDVMAETSGRIVSDPLRKGAFVEEGELLCSIAPGTRPATLAEARARLAEARARIPEAEARLEEAQARLEEAQINDRAASRLGEDGFASETRVAAARAALSSARAQLETARTGLESARSGVQSAAAAVGAAETEMERLTITAPFSGLLETDAAELGALMQPGAHCATVIQLDPIKLVGFIPETDVDKVAVGARAAARLISGREIGGEVTFLSRSADPQTRTFRVEVEVPNPDLAIRDGQTVEIAIEADGASAHLIPASALTLDDAGNLGLRTVVADPERGEIAQFVPVQVVRDTARGVFVSGLPEVARVIVVGQEYVRDGVPVDVTLRQPGEMTQ
jgi:multidrug efflux system membrane fusion protein